MDLFWGAGRAFEYSAPLVLQPLHSAWASTTTSSTVAVEVSRLHLCLRPLDTKNQNGLGKIDI
jgi:hypothetical protein